MVAVTNTSITVKCIKVSPAAVTTVIQMCEVHTATGRGKTVGVFCIRSVQLLNKLLHRPICKGCYEPYAARVHSTFILGILYQYYRRSGEGYTGGTSIIFFNSINLFLYKETVKGFYEE